MTIYRDQNRFENDYWPDHWADEDLRFLATFLCEEFGAELVYEYAEYDEFDYGLYVQVDE